MEKNTGNEPANPIIKTTEALKGQHSGGNAYGNVYSTGGLTIRQHFAAIAMQGLLVNYVEHGLYGNQTNYPMVSEIAVRCADDLIAALNK